MNNDSLAQRETSSTAPRGGDLAMRTYGTSSEPGGNRAAGRRGTSWVVSLTLVCFAFGGLLAMQLRAVERVRTNNERKAAGDIEAKHTTDQLKHQFDLEKQNSANLQKSLVGMQSKLAAAGANSNRAMALSAKQVSLLNAQLRDLQRMAALTAVEGPGVRVVLSDNPEAAKAGGGPFLPGIVHDYDLLQVVNELRAAKADAIAINGQRISGYTPIRCVGPVVHINWEAAASPFRIEAVGDPQTLSSALKMPGGILEKLGDPNMGAGLGVRISTEDRLQLPAIESVPRLKVAKAM